MMGCDVAIGHWWIIGPRAISIGHLSLLLFIDIPNFVTFIDRSDEY